MLHFFHHVLEGLEKEAREAKKGLWMISSPVPPWEWSRDCVCLVERAVHGIQKILGFEQPARSS
jgi:hypothetical protein